METHAPYAQWLEAGTLTLGVGPASVVVTPNPLGLAGGATGQLTATGTALDGYPVATSYAWSSEVTAVAAVSPSGLVTAIGPGVSQVRATAPNSTYGESRVVVGATYYLTLASGAYGLDDAGPATAALVYDPVTNLLQVDSNPAAVNALEIHGLASGTVLNIALSDT